MSVLHFLSYHNAVPIAVSIVILGGTATFAATNPEAIYSENEVVVSIDNTYLVSKDLATFSPRAEIIGVTEDEESYYVAYSFYTIDLAEYVWKDVVKSQTMKVSKAMLGEYRDLGVYVTEQLKENIDAEEVRLAETQAIEQRQVSQKVVATEYGGLVGKMLDTTTEILPGYTPVVTPPPEVLVAAAAESSSSSATIAPVAVHSGTPIIQILGNNPASVSVGASYSDLGAVITGPTDADRNLGIRIFVNDVEMGTPAIDTSRVGNWFIRYEVTNGSGVRAIAERVVIVTDPNASPASPVGESSVEMGQQSPIPTEIVATSTLE